MVRRHLELMLFREVFRATGTVSFIFLYGTSGLIRGERSFSLCCLLLICF